MNVLLLASTGGHLAQLHQLQAQLVSIGDRVVWATFETPQSQSLLCGEEVEYLPYVAPRDWRTILTNTRAAIGVLRRNDIQRLVTTGSGIALSFLPAARALGIDCSYIESAARGDGPSVTGRLAALTPGVRTYTQYDSWSSKRWLRAPSVFDDFVEDDLAEQPTISKVVVSLGTIAGYGFRSLVERTMDILPPDADVLWQTGVTDVSGLNIKAVPFLSQAELLDAMAAADVVITHAGIGSALATLTLGKVPVLVPRRQARGEHVDDHQMQIARDLLSRGLAVTSEVDNLTTNHVHLAARSRVRSLSATLMDAGLPLEAGVPVVLDPVVLDPITVKLKAQSDPPLTP